MPTSIHRQLSYREKQAKTHAFIAYGLMVGGLFTGLLFLIGFIWAMVKKTDAQGTMFADHYTNIIKTFYWLVPSLIVGYLLTFFIIGYIILFALWAWLIFRIATGILKLTSNQPYYS